MQIRVNMGIETILIGFNMVLLSNFSLHIQYRIAWGKKIGKQGICFYQKEEKNVVRIRLEQHFPIFLLL
jgi:hypothetical protein